MTTTLGDVFNGDSEFLEKVEILPVGSYGAGSYSLPTGYSWTDFERVEVAGSLVGKVQSIQVVDKSYITENPSSFNVVLNTSVSTEDRYTTLVSTGISTFDIGPEAGGVTMAYIIGYTKTYRADNSPSPYTDPDAIGANATAEIYPDGTIVGSTDNGSYTKRPDGTLVIRSSFGANTWVAASNAFGSTSGDCFSSDDAVLFPHEFASAPSVTASTMGIAVKINTTTSTTGTAFRTYYQFDSIARQVMYIAIGRWK